MISRVARFGARSSVAFTRRAMSSKPDLSHVGLKLAPNATVHHNLSYDDIFKHEVADGNVVTKNGTVAVDTGKFTGRSPKDKYIVKQAPSDANVSSLHYTRVL
jgi:ATP-dependent phosphoenolpyruvate carboxykinase